MLSKSDLEAIKALLDEAINTSATSLKNEFIKRFDLIMGRLDKIDQELEITNSYGDKLENHEERITKLEEKRKRAIQS